MANILPEAKTQFVDGNGKPYAGGFVYFYIPSTTTPKSTWQDAAQTILNQNPVVLDGDGRAIIFGSGAYRQQLYDVNMNLVWDQLTYSPASSVDFSDQGVPGGAGLVGFDGNTLAQQLTNRIDRVCKTIAELRTLVHTTYQHAFVEGYYASGDGGGGMYWYDSTDTTSSDNGGTIIVASDGARWKLIHTGSVSARQFGAKGNGTTDDTNALQTAVIWAGSVTGGAEIYVPNGTYKLSVGILINQPGVVIRGESKRGTKFVQSVTGNSVWSVAADNTILKNFSTDYSVTATSGGLGAIVCNGQYCRYESIIVNNPYIGFYFTISPFQNATDIQVFNYISIGIYCTMINDIFVSQFTLRANSTTNGALGGIRLFNRCEACCFTDGEILEGQFPITTDSATYGFGVSPAFNTFTNCFFDSAQNAAGLNNLLETVFEGCWFSNGHSVSGSAGMLLSQSDGVKFTGCRFDNCGADGARVQNSAHRFAFVGCSANGNGQVTGNAAAGYYIEGGTTDFVISGSSAANNVFLGSQGYGIYLAAGATNRFSIVDNQLANNSLGAMQDNSSGTTKHISGNVGYNPLPGAVQTVGASPWTYTNNTGNTVSLNCNGGTVSLATLNGNKFSGATDFSISIPQASAITITYSSIPVVQVFGQ